MATEEKPKIPLPKDWTGNVRSAVLHVIGLAQYATAYTRSWAANSPNERMRLKAENDRLEVAGSGQGVNSLARRKNGPRTSSCNEVCGRISANTKSLECSSRLPLKRFHQSAETEHGRGPAFLYDRLSETTIRRLAVAAAEFPITEASRRSKPTSSARIVVS
jgi:hypothetical protein